MACAIAVARSGQQRSLTRTFQVLSVAIARSPRARIFAWARLTAFCRRDSFGRIKEPRYLDERPVEVEGRQVPGHGEGDLVIGKGGKSAVATLVERTSRFVVLVPLSGRDALTVGDAVIAAAGLLPPQIAKSLTWDCGSEMAGHARITAAGCRCISPARTRRGNAAATRTRTVSCASISRKACRLPRIRSIWQWWLAK
jgi:integrase-like protein